MTPDFSRIKREARAHLPAMSAFLRDMIRLPGESRREEAVIRRIQAEMDSLGCRTEIDGMGNVLGFLGQGPRLVAFDAHIDTVGVGRRESWNFDPYAGCEDDRIIGGLGSSDQKGGMAAMLYGGVIMRDLGLVPDDVTVVMTGTVQEEDCDGLCWQYLVRERGLRPELVVCTESTDGGIYRGHRGRMEIRVDVRGRAAHGSAPERGDNAIFRMGRILAELEELGAHLADDPFLGKGTLTVSEIFFTAPSRCAVADSCAVSIDRRLTAGETEELALGQIRALPSVRAAGDRAEVSVYRYAEASWTGLVYPAACSFPAWVLPREHRGCRAAEEAYRGLFGREPRVGAWTFSTNGTAIMGMFGIPVIGFGPGRESEAHAPDEKTWKDDLVTAAALYAALPALYANAGE
ncbi:MAG: YgeY family selenium metabolism-linked hydrolase [Desulfovibrionaceae bacterium]|nr:YgeY family selenium metabolism-linked hydrolase [Desulfovibrionaceae bacterium]